MTKLFPILVIVPFAALLAAARVPTSQAPTARAWIILQQGLTSKSAARRANAAHALRLLAHRVLF
jgi:hypothetical protein